MHNIWHTCYKKLDKNGYLDLYSVEYDLKLVSIKLFMKSDNHDEYYLYAEEVQYYSFTNDNGLTLLSFEFSDELEKKDRPFHFFYEVENSTLIESLVENSAELLPKEHLKHFLVRVTDGLFDIVTWGKDVKIVEIKREF